MESTPCRAFSRQGALRLVFSPAAAFTCFAASGMAGAHALFFLFGSWRFFRDYVKIFAIGHYR
jgi:hypothetical protein